MATSGEKLVLTINGDLSALSTADKTELKTAVTATVAKKSRIKASDIYVTLTAGSIVATVNFAPTVSAASITVASDSVAEQTSYTVGGKALSVTAFSAYDKAGTKTVDNAGGGGVGSTAMMMIGLFCLALLGALVKLYSWYKGRGGTGFVLEGKVRLQMGAAGKKKKLWCKVVKQGSGSVTINFEENGSPYEKCEFIHIDLEHTPNAVRLSTVPGSDNDEIEIVKPGDKARVLFVGNDRPKWMALFKLTEVAVAAP